jgi:hypothetical protein
VLFIINLLSGWQVGGINNKAYDGFIFIQTPKASQANESFL